MRLKAALIISLAAMMVAGLVGVLWPQSVPWSGIACGAVACMLVAGVMS